MYTTRISRTRKASELIARRWRRNRVITIDSCERSLTVNSRSVFSDGGMTLTGPIPVDAAAASAALGRLVVSLIANPWVEHGVEDVGDDVADNDNEAHHHQPSHDDV